MKIKDLALSNRPRERLITLGPGALSDAELLAIILRQGTRNENVIDMSNRIIAKYGLDKLASCSNVQLQRIKGIGKAKVCQISAVCELSKRFSSQGNSNVVINSAKSVYEYAYPKLRDLDRECFMVIHLDAKNRVIRDVKVSVGTLTSSLIHPREVFKEAIKDSANAIILVHNHPSGDVTPSEEDKKVTKMLQEAGELLNIKVLDHVIVGDGYWSFKDESSL